MTPHELFHSNPLAAAHVLNEQTGEGRSRCEREEAQVAMGRVLRVFGVLVHAQHRRAERVAVLRATALAFGVKEGGDRGVGGGQRSKHFFAHVVEGGRQSHSRPK